VVGIPREFPLVFEAGPLGVAEGGVVYLQVSPFWGWSTPQTGRPEALGFTRVSTPAEGVELRMATLDQQLLGIEVRGRALRPGERIRIDYGAPPGLAMPDRFAERGSRFWIAVDGDGDGVRKVLEDSPALEVLPGPPARLLLTLPTIARRGDRIRLGVALVDAAGNAGIPVAGELLLAEPHPGLDLPGRLELPPAARGTGTLEGTVAQEGIFRLRGIFKLKFLWKAGEKAPYSN
jgi:hypothetical protein